VFAPVGIKEEVKVRGLCNYWKEGDTVDGLGFCPCDSPLGDKIVSRNSRKGRPAYTSIGE